MQIGKESLANFIGGTKTFYIPVYQRNYDWQQDNCKQLLLDIEQIIMKKRTHFFGTFVYQHIPAVGQYQKFIIIDGQQRITSTILFAKALYDLSTDEDEKDNIKTSLLQHSQGNFDYRFKLKPLDYDLEVFEKLMDCEDLNNFPEEYQSSNLYKNYNFFKKTINESQYTINELFNAIYGLEIVGLLLDTENPQEIFESLNSTGIDLSNTDLIRNYLLMPLLEQNRQEELYQKYWLNVERMIQSNNMETFILQYLITKRKSNSVFQNDKKLQLTKTNLYRSFKEYFVKRYDTNDHENAIESFLKDMHRYAVFYKHFRFNANTVVSKLSTLDKKFYELTYLLDASYAPIILMYIYDKYDKGMINEGTFIKFVDALISLAFRARVCRYYVISAQFAGNVIARLDQKPLTDDSMDDFWAAITFGKGSYAFPNDEQFRQSLMTESLFTTIKSEGCKYLLYSLELNSDSTEELPDYDKCTIDHIMPTKLDRSWKNYLQSKNDLQMHGQYMHTLGNLTLTNYNEKQQNNDFETKQQEYAKSNFYYTKELSAPSDWTSKQIQLRAKKLAGLALKIWTLPAKYNSVIPVIENIFNLDADAGTFTGTKLDIVSILGKDKRVTTWSSFLNEITKTFYSIDKDIFKEAASKDNVPYYDFLFSEIPINPHKSTKLDKEYYLNFDMHLSANVCFKVIKAIVENVDLISKTNFKEDIWFTLKK